MRICAVLIAISLAIGFLHLAATQDGPAAGDSSDRLPILPMPAPAVAKDNPANDGADEPAQDGFWALPANWACDQTAENPARMVPLFVLGPSLHANRFTVASGQAGYDPNPKSAQPEILPGEVADAHYVCVPIVGPMTWGGPTVMLDGPTPDEVMRALERAHAAKDGGLILNEVQRNNVQMTIEPIADYVDPPRVYPLIGPAQLHHAHYKCEIWFTEVTRVGWPMSYSIVDEDAHEVIYIDHNHFHIAPPPAALGE